MKVYSIFILAPRKVLLIMWTLRFTRPEAYSWLLFTLLLYYYINKIESKRQTTECHKDFFFFSKDL